MHLSIDSTFWLICAGAAGLVVLLSWRVLGAMVWQRRLVAVVARVLVLATLAFALAGLSSVRTIDRIAVIAVIDMSRSAHVIANVSKTGTDSVRGRIDLWLTSIDAQRRADDLVGIVAFDGRAIVVQTPNRARAGDVMLDIPAREGTNIEQAIAVALAMLPADTRARIVLFTDGNQTAGDVLDRVITDGRNIPIDVVPISYSLKNEVAVVRVDAPSFAPQGADIPVRAHIRSTHNVDGEIRAFDGDIEVDLNGEAPGAALAVSLSTGMTLVPIAVPGSERRLHELSVAFEPGIDGNADVFLENNIARALTVSPGRGRVLVVAEQIGSTQRDPLRDAIESAGFATDLVVPEAMPTGIAGYAEYDAVILDDVSANSMAADSLISVDQFVRSFGGGLIVVGGMNSFGPGGYRGTPLEHLVPVLLDIPDRIVRPDVAIVIVLDRSGSMAQSVLGSVRSQQMIANESAAIAIARLEPTDLVGVIAFDNAYSRVVPLGPNIDPLEAGRKLRKIYPNGGTNLGPALVAAMNDLDKVDAEKKHIIVLSDGRSQHEERLPDIAKRVAKAGITITSISVGDGSAAPMMREIAQATNGTFFEVIHPDRLPRVFIDAVRVERSPRVLEQRFEPQITFATSPLIAGFSSFPGLNGLVLARDRDDPRAIVVARGPDNLPLLAEWQVELGRVVAFTSDSRLWAKDWLTWNGYRQFWSQIVQRAGKPSQAAGLAANISSETETLVLTLEAVDESAEPLVDLLVRANVIDPNGIERVVTLTQTAPGVYETSTQADVQGAYVAAVRAERHGQVVGTALAAQIIENERELSDTSSNDALVSRIASRTGGQVLDLSSPGMTDVFSREGLEPAQARSSLWQWLVWLALGLYLCDIATRRIAWDRLLGLGDKHRTVGDFGSASANRLSALISTQELPEQRQAISLTDDDADQLAIQQQQARRTRVIDELRSHKAAHEAKHTPIETELKDKGFVSDSSGETSGLLAAKRRAMKRFEEDTD